MSSVESVQEASILDVKSALVRELRGSEGFKVMQKESQVGASAADAMVEISAWKMQNTARSLIAFVEWVHNTTLVPGSAILAWSVEFPGQMVSRFQGRVSDVKATYER